MAKFSSAIAIAVFGVLATAQAIIAEPWFCPPSDELKEYDDTEPWFDPPSVGLKGYYDSSALSVSVTHMYAGGCGVQQGKGDCWIGMCMKLTNLTNNLMEFGIQDEWSYYRRQNLERGVFALRDEEKVPTAHYGELSPKETKILRIPYDVNRGPAKGKEVAYQIVAIVPTVTCKDGTTAKAGRDAAGRDFCHDYGGVAKAPKH
jgi:hypothetical protein